MVKLGTVQITHNVPFQMYLLSNVRLKRMLLEYQFHSVRFYREERAKEFTVCLDYPYGNLYWFVDFKKSVEEDGYIIRLMNNSEKSSKTRLKLLTNNFS